MLLKGNSSSIGVLLTISANATITTMPLTSTPAPTSTGFVATITDIDGIIRGCTSASELVVTAGTSVTTSTLCVGAGVPLSTNAALWSSWQALVSSVAPVSAPSDGCTIVNANDGTDNKYCTCAGGSTPTAASSVSTILGYSAGTLITACNTPRALPTDYVEVPPIAYGEVAADNQLWTDPPSGNCTDGNVLREECWDLLSLDQYLEWWEPAFEGHCDGVHFSECFFIAMTTLAPTNCTQIDGNCPTATWDPFISEWNGVRNFYVASTIWNMNNFFNQYYTALGTAEETAALMIGTIVNTTDPIKKTNIALSNILEALSVGLALIPGPESVIADSILEAVKQAPGVASFLFPQGTMDNQLEEMQEISGNFANVVTALRSSISNALPAVMSNVTNFRAFAKSGVFSGDMVVDQNGLSNQILSGLMTYLLSQAYQANGVFLTRQLNTSVRALSTNGTKLNWPLCTSDYDGNGLCDTWWYDEADDTTYGLVDPNNVNHNFNSEMQKWFYNYTTPQLLFKGAVPLVVLHINTALGPQGHWA